MQRQGLSSVNRHAIDAELAAKLVDHHPAAIVVQDAEGRVVAINRAASRLLGDAVPLRVGTPSGLRHSRVPHARHAVRGRLRPRARPQAMTGRLRRCASSCRPGPSSTSPR